MSAGTHEIVTLADYELTEMRVTINHQTAELKAAWAEIDALRQQVSMSDTDVAAKILCNLNAENEAERRKIVPMLRKIDELEQAIRALIVVEWIEFSLSSRCPWCDGLEPDDDPYTSEWKRAHTGHAPDCPRQSAAALVGEQ